MRTRNAQMALAVLLICLLLAPVALEAEGAQGGHKVQFEYLAYPETTFVESERRMDICLVNHGADGELIYDGGKELDQVVVSIPVGPLDDDLTDDPMTIYCQAPGGWLCLGPDVVGEDMLLTLRPDGSVQVPAGETLCFRVVVLNVNPEMGLAFLGVDQQIDSKRAMPGVNERMAVFKTDLPPIAHDDLAELRPDQHHARYTDGEAWQVVLDRDGPGSGLDADTVDGHEGEDVEESQEIDDDIAAHAAVSDAHHAKTTRFSELTDTAADAQIPDDITIDYARIAGDADTVDGHEGADLEESREIDDDIAAHAGIPGAHHTKTTSFSDLTDTATDAQVPDDITIDYAARAGSAASADQAANADMVDGMHADAFVRTTGATMTGALILPPGEPSGDAAAATKDYVDEVRDDLEDQFEDDVDALREELCMGLWKSGVAPSPALECPSLDGLDETEKVEICNAIFARGLEPPPWLQGDLGCYRYVFVTSDVYQGYQGGAYGVGGMAGADARCQALAEAAGLPGRYKAWLSSDNGLEFPLARFTHSTVPYKIKVKNDDDFDLEIVADDWGDLTDGHLDHAIDRDENGDPVGHPRRAWSATTEHGSSIAPSDFWCCNRWTSSKDNVVARIGLAAATDHAWTNWPDIQNGDQRCDQWCHLYCFQQ